MNIQTEKIIVLFFLYSFIGWLWETIYDSIKQRKFVYRGFLVGPYCPIYGFGILGVVYLLKPFHHNILLLYILSAVLVSVLEYVTSFVLEKLFHATWWDYKDVPLNLNGRIALPVSLFWGLACVFIIGVVHPRVNELANAVVERFGALFPVFIVSVMGADLIYTVYNMRGFQKAVADLDEAYQDRKSQLEFKKDMLKEQLLERGAAVKEVLTDGKETLQNKTSEVKTAFPKLTATQRRFLHNYERLRFKGIERASWREAYQKFLAERKEEKNNHHK